MKQILCSLALSLICIVTFSQSISNDTIHWASYRKLDWNDFKGSSIDVQGLSGQALMVILANFQKLNLFFPVKTHVVTVFDRKNSWVTDAGKTDQSLKYYQVMFDLYEVYARKLRKDFKETKFGMDPNKVFQEKYESELSDLSDRNKQYMQETKLGTDADALKKWEDEVHRELQELSKYSIP